MFSCWPKLKITECTYFPSKPYSLWESFPLLITAMERWQAFTFKHHLVHTTRDDRIVDFHYPILSCFRKMISVSDPNAVLVEMILSVSKNYPKVYCDAQHTFLCCVYFSPWGKITAGAIFGVGVYSAEAGAESEFKISDPHLCQMLHHSLTTVMLSIGIFQDMKTMELHF